MKLTGKNILIVSPEPWDHIFVSKHHYATHLAEKGNQVVFVNPAGSQWRLSDTDTKGLRVLEYPKFIKGLRLLPRWVCRHLIRRKLNQIQQFCGQCFDILWSFDNSVFFDFSLLPTFNISHIVDLNQDFETQRAAQTADLCLACSQAILDRLKRFNPNAHFIDHGYNRKPVTQKISLPGKNKLKALYAGNLDMPYLDWSILLTVVKNHPDVDFVLIGPWTGNKRALNNTSRYVEKVFNSDNVCLIGKVRSDKLPNYYASADLLMILYQEAHHSDQANPHKMMEYLGTEKPIVATYTAMFDDVKYKGLLSMSHKNEDYPCLFEQAIVGMDLLRTSEACSRRREIALANSYPKQIERIEKLIHE